MAKNSPARAGNKPRIEFYALLILLGLATLYITKSYLGMFMLSFVIALIFDPLYKKFNKKFGKEYLASALTTATVFLLVILPFILIGSLVVRETIQFTNQLDRKQTARDAQEFINDLEQRFPDLADQIEGYINQNDIDIGKTALSFVKTTSSFVSHNVVPLAQFGVSAVLNTILFVFILIYTFPSKDKLTRYLLDISPIEKSDTVRLGIRFNSIVRATITGTLAIAVAQGILGALMLWILGVPAPAFWGVLITIFSVIPVLGSAIVWLPISLVLLISGQLVSAAVFFLWGVLVLSSVDNVLRPRFMGKGDAQMPELLTLMSVLGGVQVFGFFGFIYGPVIAAMFITTLNIYKKNTISIK